MKRLLLLMFLIVILPFYINAQNIYKNEKHFWFNAGMGFGLSKYTSGLAIGGNISYQSDDNLLTVRSVFTTDGKLNFIPPENFWDLGILYGKCKQFGKTGYASIAFGVAVVGGTRRGSFLFDDFFFHYYKSLPYLTIGIPIEAQLF